MNHLFVLTKLMRWAFKAVLLLLGAWQAGGCGSGYRQRNGKATYNGKPVAGNLVVLNDAFAKSDTAVYYYENSVTGADPATFEALSESYAKDKRAVYFCSTEREGQNYYLTRRYSIVTIEDADAASFQLLGGPYSTYAKDRLKAYRNGIAFPVKDAAGLQWVEGDFIKDAHQVYFRAKVIPAADPQHFRVLDHTYATDQRQVWMYGLESDVYSGIFKVPCDAASFVALDYPYCKDAHAVYCRNRQLSGSNPATFRVLGGGFSKDEQHVYYEAGLIAGADAASFELVGGTDVAASLFAKDRLHAYFADRVITGAEAAAFAVLGLDYATDGKHIYYQQQDVKAATVNSFKVYDHAFGDADAEDSRYKYSKGKITGNAGL